MVAIVQLLSNLHYFQQYISKNSLNFLLLNQLFDQLTCLLLVIFQIFADYIMIKDWKVSLDQASHQSKEKFDRIVLVRLNNKEQKGFIQYKAQTNPPFRY